MKVPVISIVIINYNVRDLILKCIDSIYKFTTEAEDIEIIVFDNNSSDNSVDEIEKRFPHVNLIASSINLGFPKANNECFKIAKGDYIFMLNPDTELIEDSIKLLKNYLLVNPNIKLVAPQLLNSDCSIQDSCWKFPKINYIIADDFYLKSLFPGRKYKNKSFDFPFEVESASGAALFFNKNLINEIGDLDENLFWIEDIDFCYRLKQKKGKIIYNPDTKIIHHIGQSAKKNYNISISNQIINKIKFFKKHYDHFSIYLIITHSLINTMLKLFIFLIISPFSKVHYLKFKAYLYTIPQIIKVI